MHWRSGSGRHPTPTPRRQRRSWPTASPRPPASRPRSVALLRRLRDQAAAAGRAEGSAGHRHQRHRPARQHAARRAGCARSTRPRSPAATSCRRPPGRRPRRATASTRGAPFSAQSFALIVRKDWREKVGLEVPKTWDDLAALAKAFTDEGPRRQRQGRHGRPSSSRPAPSAATPRGTPPASSTPTAATSSPPAAPASSRRP